jgi:hypothetical protein
MLGPRENGRVGPDRDAKLERRKLLFCGSRPPWFGRSLGRTLMVGRRSADRRPTICAQQAWGKGAIAETEFVEHDLHRVVLRRLTCADQGRNTTAQLCAMWAKMDGDREDVLA